MADALTTTIPLSKTTSFIVDNRGKTAPTSGTGVVLIATNCVSNNDLYPAYKDVRYVSAETYKTWFRAHPQPGDVLLTLKGSQNGAVCLVPDPVAFAIAQDMVALRADSAVIDPLYLFAALRSPGVQQQIKNLDVSGVIPHFKKTDFDKLRLPYPNRSTQTFIGELYFALCSKVDINRRMNEVLEAMTRAIFKDWFVDFGPTRAKMEGRAPYLASDLWALFPDRLDDEGKPDGWTKQSIYGIAEVIYGAPFSSALFNTTGNGDPLIRIRDLSTESPGVWTPEVHPKGYKVKPGDIVVGMDGEFRAYLWGGAESWMNQRVCVFAPREEVSSAFVRNSILDPLAEVEASEVATTVIHLGKNDIDRFSIVVPDRAVLSAFNNLGQPMYDRIVANKLEARTLSATRDLLLPKLMSGEIHITDVEKIAEAAA